MKSIITILVAALCSACIGTAHAQQGTYDIRGQWVGDAQGVVFGAKGSVVITDQRGEDIRGVAEGSNVFGSARFGIAGKIRGNYIFGNKEGNTFQGWVYPDNTIRGMVRAVTGDEFQITLRKSYQYWGMPQNSRYQYE
jgi:hypothetical protein